MKRNLLLGALLASSLSLSALAATPSVEGAKAYIISPADGETVSSALVVRFGLQGMGVAPAGVEREKTGHHHLLIDGKSLPAKGQPMGTDVKHFGGGQTEVELTLEPGAHTLQLILGDHMHMMHEPMVASEVVHITVK